jgi:hypothetical protein
MAMVYAHQNSPVDSVYGGNAMPYSCSTYLRGWVRGHLLAHNAPDGLSAALETGPGGRVNRPGSSSAGASSRDRPLCRLGPEHVEVVDVAPVKACLTVRKVEPGTSNMVTMC